MKRVVFWLLTILFILITSLILSALFWPNIFTLIMNVVWLILFFVTAVFVSVAILVFIGLKNQAKKLMNVIFEGSLSILDIFEFIDLAWKLFVKILKEFILFITPLIVGVILVGIYLLLMIYYKSYGRENDVTTLTIILTVILVAFSGIISLPKKKVHVSNPGWWKKFRTKFGNYFRDGLEILVFVFFLTLDSTDLFFLPAELNTPLEAEIMNYDLMKISLVYDSQFAITIYLIVGAIALELFRTLLILIVQGVKNYKEGKSIMLEKGYTFAPVKLFKAAMKKAFINTVDDFLKFIVYTTILVGVFVFFPRLKLLSMLVASCTGLILDLIFTQRMKFAYGEDLLSKIIIKVARLN